MRRLVVLSTALRPPYTRSRSVTHANNSLEIEGTEALERETLRSMGVGGGGGVHAHVRYHAGKHVVCPSHATNVGGVRARGNTQVCAQECNEYTVCQGYAYTDGLCHVYGNDLPRGARSPWSFRKGIAGAVITKGSGGSKSYTALNMACMRRLVGLSHAYQWMLRGVVSLFCRPLPRLVSIFTDAFPVHPSAVHAVPCSCSLHPPTSVAKRHGIYFVRNSRGACHYAPNRTQHTRNIS